METGQKASASVLVTLSDHLHPELPKALSFWGPVHMYPRTADPGMSAPPSFCPEIQTTKYHHLEMRLQQEKPGTRASRSPSHTIQAIEETLKC